jgi:hypothetical protein
MRCEECDDVAVIHISEPEREQHYCEKHAPKLEFDNPPLPEDLRESNESHLARLKAAGVRARTVIDERCENCGAPAVIAVTSNSSGRVGFFCSCKSCFSKYASGDAMRLDYARRGLKLNRRESE